MERTLYWFFLAKKAFSIHITFLVLFIILAIAAILSSASHVGPSELISSLADKNSIGTLSDGNSKAGFEVFGFAPYWTLKKLENVDFSILTTLAYFGLPIHADGSIDMTHNGAKLFSSTEATELFRKAHKNGTRVVVAVTQMDNETILKFMDDKNAQSKMIDEVVKTVKQRGIDGVNVDFEYIGDPGNDYRRKFGYFLKKLTERMHNANPASKVTVSVYASAVKEPKLYDIKSLGVNSDGIFMMAYDFATPGSNNVIPTAPLYGYKEGKYWYDISSAVDDFLQYMPKEKLILGLPWYGYDYPVAEPAVKAAKNTGYYTYYWYRGRKYSRFVARPGAYASTYQAVKANTIPEQEGWDDYGKVGWKAYRGDDGWRMLFLDDVRSLSIKYDFAKEKDLGGVGIWALGFDHGMDEMWDLLSSKFGTKLVDSRVLNKAIYE